MANVGWNEDVAADAKKRRNAERVAPLSATSPITKAQKGEIMPWATTHEESVFDEGGPGTSNIQAEQVPLRLSKTALDIAAKLRKGVAPAKKDTADGDADDVEMAAKRFWPSGDMNVAMKGGKMATRAAAATRRAEETGEASDHEKAAQVHEAAMHEAFAAGDAEAGKDHQRMKEQHEGKVAKARVGKGSFGEAVRDHTKEPETTERGKIDGGAAPVQDVSKVSTDSRVSKADGYSFESVSTALSAAVRLRFPPNPATDGLCGSRAWVRDVFDDYVVVENNGQLVRIPYVFDGKAATLGAEATPVRVSYVSA